MAVLKRVGRWCCGTTIPSDPKLATDAVGGRILLAIAAFFFFFPFEPRTPEEMTVYLIDLP